MKLSAISLTFAFLTFVSTAKAEPPAPFRVGLVLPLTGAGADYGIAIRNSIELARKDRPELFGNIVFEYEDTPFDPKLAVSAFNKLLDAGRINLAVTWGVAFCKVLAPIAESKKMPLIGICLDPAVAANKRYVIRFKNPIDDIMRVQARYLFDHGVKRVGLLLADHPYLEEAMQALKRNLVEGQTLEVIEQLPNNDNDLRTQLFKLKARKADFDAIGVFLFIGQVSSFYKQARDLHVELSTFGTDIFESESEVKASNGAMNGAIYSSVEIKPSFLKRYREMYHTESQLSFGAPAYEFAMSVGELFNKLGAGISADEIVHSFASVALREGTASGPYKYVNDPKFGQYFEFPVVVKKIDGDAFEVVR